MGTQIINQLLVKAEKSYISGRKQFTFGMADFVIEDVSKNEAHVCFKCGADAGIRIMKDGKRVLAKIA